MSDRFDEMRARGINTNDATATANDILQGKTAYVSGHKITGILVPSGGSDDLNVFVQETEPEKKEGIWIKSNEDTGDVKCLYHNAPEGEFMDNATVSFLKHNNLFIGQVIVDGFLYEMAWASGNSYKCNLKTGQWQSISTPTMTASGASIGAVYYGGYIWVFCGGRYSGDSAGYFYKYDPVNNTYTNPQKFVNSFSNYYPHTTPYVYNDAMYFGMLIYSNYFYKYDFKTGVFTTINTDILTPTDTQMLTSSFGKYMYVLRGTYGLWRYDYTTNQSVKILDYSRYGNLIIGGLYATGSYIYIFPNSGYTYYRYNIGNDTVETITAQFPYYLQSNSYIGGNYLTYYTTQQIVLDDQTGKLYFRYAYEKDGNYYYGTPSVMQLEDPNQELVFEDGTVVLTLNTANRYVKLQDSSGIYTGVQNTYIIDDSEFDGNHVSCWGDGVRWNLLKNPTGETCTVTFNTDGGSSIPSQTITCGQKATKPSTNPSKTDYIFDDWYLGNKPFDFNTPLVSNTTLTAHYLTYEEVSYIQSTGTQYIDTGILPTLGTRLVVDCKFNDLSVGRFGAYGNQDSGRRFYFGVINSQWIVGYGDGSGYNHTVGTANLNRHTFEINDTNFLIDGVSAYSYTRAWNSTSGNIALFAFINGSTPEHFAIANCYSVKIYQSNTLVRDFQPILITSTNEYAMLDKVENKVYHNAGTGVFIGDGYEPPVILDYIQSTGTQYIDTGYKPTGNTSLEMDIQILGSTGTTTWVPIFGERNTSSGSESGSFASYYQLANPTIISYLHDSQDLNDSSNPVGNVTNRQVLKYTQTAAYVDNVKAIDVSSTSFTATLSIHLFALKTHFTGSTEQVDSRELLAKLYSCKIYDNGTLVRDFVPCKDESGVVCMWDRASGAYYYNQGSGEFLTPDYEPTYLEYIESTGTQYIDTGIIPNGAYNVEIRTEPSIDGNNNRGFFGSRITYSGTDRFAIFFGDYNRDVYCSIQYGDTADTPSVSSYIHTGVPIVFKFGKNGVFIDNNQLVAAYGVDTSGATYSLKLCAIDTGGTISGYYGGKIYYCKIYSGSTLVRDFIPAKDTANVACLWDNVSKTFFYNAGTGTFNYGGVVNNG